MLLDTGSELSFATRELVKKLSLPISPAVLPVVGISGSTSASNGFSQFYLKSLHSSNQILVKAYVLDTLTSSLPSFSASQPQHWEHLRGLQLADPHYLTSRPVDLLVGADFFGSIVEPQIIKGPSDSPIAMLTLFGWVVLGPTCAVASAASSHHVSVSNEELSELLTSFWQQEEVSAAEGKDVALTKEEAECEEFFQRTHTRDRSGRYIVRLLLVRSPAELGDSLGRAKAGLASLLRRLEKDQGSLQLYSEFLKEYEELGHMVCVPAVPVSSDFRILDRQPGEMTLAHGASASGGLRVSEGGRSYQDSGQSSSRRPSRSSAPTFYFPHHCVLRESSETTKLRVVFNGSSKSSSGVSLNDIQHTGAKLPRNISDVLLWSRQSRYIFMTDITKMFRQIKVHREYWPLQQILWRDSRGHICTYQLTTVTYGTKSAPFLACRVLDQLVKDEGHGFPLAVSPLSSGRYVDDICGGADEEDHLHFVAQEVAELCWAGGFRLAKWVLLGWGISSTGRGLPESEAARGLHYEDSRLSVDTKPSKRVVLSEVAKLFDPLGLLSLVVIRAKALLQQLLLQKELDWDEELPAHLVQRWGQFREELSQVDQLSIPRWLGCRKDSRVEIHGFSDASLLAMSAVVYLKVTSADGISISLTIAKTKVAPLKKLTILRLELNAAVLLPKLTRYVIEQLNLDGVPVHRWTDSAVALAWICAHPSRWKEYVHNRVTVVQELVQEARWRYVSGKENPADCASRGISVTQLNGHHLWWTGPKWLREDASQWPHGRAKLDPSTDLEEKPGVTLTASLGRSSLWDLCSWYSSLYKLLRITAIGQTVVANMTRKLGRKRGVIVPAVSSPESIEAARLYWVKATQAFHLQAECDIISHGLQLKKSHPLTKLTAFIDQQGVLRVGGRLKLSTLGPESRHQAIIPQGSVLAELIISDSHQRTLHGGTQLTLAHLRRSYWIIGGRVPVRSFILKCVECARHRRIRAQQLMGQLPVARLVTDRAFSNTGVDYAGPVSIKTWKGRGHKSQKGWLVIFVCMATSALHLEAVTDYSADGFIAAYRRFVSRRGYCRHLYSDCGTNFIGADKELKKLFSAGAKEFQHLSAVCLKDGTRWTFNPPAAPHFGGKWEAAVKSVKYHLARTVWDPTLTFEELSTLLSQIEAVLNSRPLQVLSEDPDDVSCLTPGHFFIGGAPIALPESSLEHLNVGRLSRWQLIQQRLQFFWKQWSTGYLQQLQSVSKWHHPSNEIKVGSLVLLDDERFPPAKWPLARVTALHPGKDGLSRVVTIRTASTTLTRPISKLVFTDDLYSFCVSNEVPDGGGVENVEAIASYVLRVSAPPGRSAVLLTVSGDSTGTFELDLERSIVISNVPYIRRNLLGRSGSHLIQCSRGDRSFRQPSITRLFSTAFDSAVIVRGLCAAHKWIGATLTSLDFVFILHQYHNANIGYYQVSVSWL
ncbi:uncharacterized protein LOC135168625 [Diachasmimorpha longicaudata]|uniref:uncharacterized protein LOC135168625 n=1 Tax=Diachasmimorpha longicaudata TaxID=58733 RepID=UPI0030B8E9A3